MRRGDRDVTPSSAIPATIPPPPWTTNLNVRYSRGWSPVGRVESPVNNGDNDGSKYETTLRGLVIWWAHQTINLTQLPAAPVFCLPPSTPACVVRTRLVDHPAVLMRTRLRTRPPTLPPPLPAAPPSAPPHGCYAPSWRQCAAGLLQTCA